MSEHATLSGKYAEYCEYRDSGVEWLGEVPSHWGVLPCRACVNHLVAKNTDGKEDNYLSLMANIGIVLYEDKGDVGNKKPDDLTKCKLVRKGNLVINSMNYAIGSYGMSPYDGICSPVYIILDANKYVVEERYALRLFENKSFQKHLAILGNGILVHRAAISWDDIKGQYIPIPSIEEQRTIAAFLDYETARIDQLIAKQQRLIELLKEKRQAVISHAVNIREGEKSAKLSYFVDLLPGYAFPSASFKNESDGNIPLLRGVNVGVGKLKWNDTVWWPQADRVIVKDFELQVGDIVFGMDRPWIAAGARVAEVTSADLPCLLLQRVARIRTHLNTYQPFVKLCLSSYEFKSFVEADLTGVSVPHISPDQIKSFPIRAIGFEIQKVETESALRLCHVLETIEAKALQAIELMQERRTALISAAVTGKIDLRDWTPPKEG
ncbi:restriction endonuclease subunit S [Shewanella profunda]|uniref:restriction endonuclease subunit S n=1 Tax=Shewanella profunda TaxID=254793 RepID=UPI00200BC669|nr:restriction endonuclease subunit S [Shewanella profunda]MCL1090946.1 restriction endonuclease subunit S [Shewanella profunda]